jgi:hypothetical protein
MACAKPVVAAGVAGYCGVVFPENVNKMIQCHFGDHGAFAPITAIINLYIRRMREKNQILCGLF